MCACLFAFCVCLVVCVRVSFFFSGSLFLSVSDLFVFILLFARLAGCPWVWLCVGARLFVYGWLCVFVGVFVVCLCVWLRVRLCVRARMQVCACVWLSACLFGCFCACVHECVQVCAWLIK